MPPIRSGMSKVRYIQTSGPARTPNCRCASRIVRPCARRRGRELRRPHDYLYRIESSWDLLLRHQRKMPLWHDSLSSRAGLQARAHDISSDAIRHRRRLRRSWFFRRCPKLERPLRSIFYFGIKNEPGCAFGTKCARGRGQRRIRPPISRGVARGAYERRGRHACLRYACMPPGST